MKNKKAVILGAGISGLSAGYKLSLNGWDTVVIEKEAYIGGLATTYHRKNLHYDLGPHKIYTQIHPVEKEIKKILGKGLLTHPKKSSIHLFDNFLNYPIDFKELMLTMPPALLVKCGIDYLQAVAKNIANKQEFKNSEDYFKARFGEAVYQTVFKPLFTKVYGDPKFLDSDLAKTRVPFPSLLETAKQAIFRKNNKPGLSAKRFLYPKNGIIKLSQNMAETIKKNKGGIYLNAKLQKITLKKQRVDSLRFITSKGEHTFKNPDVVVSTIPLANLVEIISPPPPSAIQKAAHNLRYRSLVVIYILFKKDRLFEDSFIFFPEKRFVFQRLSEQKAFSEGMIPKGKTLLMAEIAYSPTQKNQKISEKRLISKVIKDIKKLGLKTENIEEVFSIYKDGVYPLYDLNYRKEIEEILKFTDGIENLYTIGRHGLFLYNNMDHSFDMGTQLANQLIKKSIFTKTAWQKMRKGFLEYKIVD